MDIINEILDEKFLIADEVLAYASIYDDKDRLRAYFKFLKKNQQYIKNKICLEAGSGFGLISEYMLKLGAKKVYAVEANPLLFKKSCNLLNKYKNVVLVQKSIENFIPEETIDFLVHDFFGQFLYDEQLIIFEKIKFKPKIIFPDTGQLWCGTINSSKIKDPCFDREMLISLSDILISSLYDERNIKLSKPVLNWNLNDGLNILNTDISSLTGDVLYFGLKIYHKNGMVCQAGRKSNWSYVWTYRKKNNFKIDFKYSEDRMNVYFKWIN